jgi:hypothetical protein
LEGVKQLHSGLPHGVARFTKLIGVRDSEFDPVNLCSHNVVRICSFARDVIPQRYLMCAHGDDALSVGLATDNRHTRRWSRN